MPPRGLLGAQARLTRGEQPRRQCEAEVRARACARAWPSPASPAALAASSPAHGSGRSTPSLRYCQRAARMRGAELEPQPAPHGKRTTHGASRRRPRIDVPGQGSPVGVGPAAAPPPSITSISACPMGELGGVSSPDAWAHARARRRAACCCPYRRASVCVCVAARPTGCEIVCPSARTPRVGARTHRVTSVSCRVSVRACL